MPVLNSETGILLNQFSGELGPFSTGDCQSLHMNYKIWRNFDPRLKVFDQINTENKGSSQGWTSRLARFCAELKFMFSHEIHIKLARTVGGVHYLTNQFKEFPQPTIQT